MIATKGLNKNEYDSIPCKDAVLFTELLRIAEDNTNGLSKVHEKIGLIVHEPHMLAEHFIGLSETETTSHKKEFSKLCRSNELIPDNYKAFGSFCSRPLEKQRFKDLLFDPSKQQSSVIFDIPSNNLIKNVHGSNLIVFGPHVTPPHKDLLLLGGFACIPPWNQGCAKIWIFSSSTSYSIDKFMNFCRMELKKDVVHSAESVMNRNVSFIKEFISLHKLGYVHIIIQKPGEVLEMPSGHSHSVITMFNSAINSDMVCLLAGYFKPSSIKLAFSIFTRSQQYERDRRHLRVFFSPKDIKAHTKRQLENKKKRVVKQRRCMPDACVKALQLRRIDIAKLKANKELQRKRLSRLNTEKGAKDK